MPLLKAPLTTSPCLVKERVLDAEELYDMILEDVNLYRVKDPIMSGVPAVKQLFDRVDMCFRFMEGSDLVDKSKFETIQLIRKRLSDIHGNLTDDTLDGFWEDENHVTLEDWLHSETLVPYRAPGEPLIGSGNDTVVLKRMIADRIGQLQSQGPLEFGEGNSWKLLERIEICNRYLRDNDDDSVTFKTVSSDIMSLLQFKEVHEVMTFWETIDFKQWCLKCVTSESSSTPVCQKMYPANEVHQAMLSYEEHWMKEVASAAKCFSPPAMTDVYPPHPFTTYSKKFNLSCPTSLLSVNSQDQTIELPIEPKVENASPKTCSSKVASDTSSTRKIKMRPLPAFSSISIVKGQPLLPLPTPLLPTREDNEFLVESSSDVSMLKAETQAPKRRVVFRSPERKRAAHEPILHQPPFIKPEKSEITPKNSQPPNQLIPTFSNLVTPTLSTEIPAHKQESNVSRRQKDMLFRSLKWSMMQLKRNAIVVKSNDFDSIFSSSHSDSYERIELPQDLLDKHREKILGKFARISDILDAKWKDLHSVSLQTLVKEFTKLQKALRKIMNKFQSRILSYARMNITLRYLHYPDCHRQELLNKAMEYPKRVEGQLKGSLIQLILFIKQLDRNDVLKQPVSEKSKTKYFRVTNFFKHVTRLYNCKELRVNTSQTVAQGIL